MAALVDAWPTLPMPIMAGILAMWQDNGGLLSDSTGVVYYEPETPSPQLRIGRQAVIYYVGDGTPDLRLQEDRYMQVAPANKPFGSRLDAPPYGPYLPFDAVDEAWCNPAGLPLFKSDDVVRMAQSRYFAYESDQNVTRGQRIRSFIYFDGHVGVELGNCDFTGQDATFTRLSDGTYQCRIGGMWVGP